MTLKEYKASHPQLLKQSTLCFPITKTQILLAMKKRGFGKGKWNGAGGKPQDNESIKETTVRETEEETGITPTELKEVGIVHFYYSANENWNQEVHVFKCKKWTGDIAETEEMLPKWFNLNDIPYSKMWPDDSHWLPKLLAGEIFEAEFCLMRIARLSSIGLYKKIGGEKGMIDFVNARSLCSMLRDGICAQLLGARAPAS